MTNFSFWLGAFCALILAGLWFGTRSSGILSHTGRRRAGVTIQRLLSICVVALIAWSSQRPLTTLADSSSSPLAGDALPAPAHGPSLAAAGSVTPSLYQPSSFLAGRVAVEVLFVESDGSKEPSLNDWTPAQVSSIQSQIATAMDWWRAQLPNAQLSFDISSQIVQTGYEPITHGLNTEGQWAGDALKHMGFTATNYFEQAYAASESLRRARHTDWATTIFVVNSTSKSDGRFADGRFAYAYVGGPFMVITSDAGPYGTNQITPVVTHEFGHIFGALDQYASAGTPCTQLSGYLAVPTTNSQANNCGTRFICIMLDPLAAYPVNAIDPSALGQLGYRDSNGNNIPDPLDTKPAIDFKINQPAAGGRPSLRGTAIDQPFPSPSDTPVTINTIKRVEYRVDGGAWSMLPAGDGAYDSASETISSTLPLYDGQHTVDLRAINSVGAASNITSASLLITGVGAAPIYGVDGPPLSNTSSITISLTAPAGSEVQLSADPFFSGASWSPVAAIASWQLDASDGQQTFYARFRDAAGHESPALAHTVLLDRTPPTGRAMLRPAAPPLLEIDAHDNASGVTMMQLINNDSAGTWQPYQSSLQLGNAVANATRVQVRLRDAAGNVSPALSIANPTFLPIAQR